MLGDPWKFMFSDFFWVFINLYDFIVEFFIRNTILSMRLRFNYFDKNAPQSEFDLLYLNAWISILNQIVLFLITLPIAIFYPLMMGLAMEPGYIRQPKLNSYVDEKWFFVNGIMVNKGSLDQNCRYLEARFGRGVTGLYNITYGIFWDFVEAILGRSFEVETIPVRLVTDQILEALRNDKIKTVRLIAHSQGTIITNLALKKLHYELSYGEKGEKGEKEQNLLKKLEVFTFANVCREFINPGGLIRRIEHYANDQDPIAKLGVLNDKTNSRIQGNIFVNNRKGHLFNSYYSLNASDYTSSEGAIPKLLDLPGNVPNLPL